MVVFAVLPLRYAAPFPLINPGRPQFCFAFHARDYPRVAHPSEGGVQRTLTDYPRVAHPSEGGVQRTLTFIHLVKRANNEKIMFRIVERHCAIDTRMTDEFRCLAE